MLRKLFQISSGSSNPSYLTGLQPGGAGAATSGITTAPGISSPAIEPFFLEVQDVTAPTKLTAVAGKTTPASPAAVGNLLVLDPLNSGPGGWMWKLSSVKGQQLPRGQYGIVVKAGNVANAGFGVATAFGNIASSGDRAVVCIDGPVQALVQTTVGGFAISAGMPLQADGGGNLTGVNQGLPGVAGGASTGPPLPGQVLATALQNVATSVSTPSLVNVYVGGY